MVKLLRREVGQIKAYTESLPGAFNDNHMDFIVSVGPLDRTPYFRRHFISNRIEPIRPVEEQTRNSRKLPILFDCDS
jgi:hypothetical protein